MPFVDLTESEPVIVRGGLGVHQNEPGEQFVVDSDAAPSRDERPWVARTAKQSIPFPVAGMLWFAAETAHANLDAFPLAAPAASAVYLVAAMGCWMTWAKNHPENRAARRLWATVLIGSGSTWMLWASLAGPTGMALAALVAGGSAAILPYWARHALWRPGRRQQQEPLEVAPVELEVPDEAPELATVAVEPSKTANQLHWDQVIAAPGGISSLEGTYLTDPVITDDIEQYTIQTVNVRQTAGTVLSVAANIAGAYGRGIADAAVLRHPSGVEDKALIRFTRSNPLARNRAYPGPHQALDLTGGNIRTLIGYHADGTPVWWVFYQAGYGTFGGAVFGDTGSGKSFLLRLLIASAAYSGLIVPIVSCPQGGASFPMWIRHGHWPGASAQEILLQARALREAHKTRSAVTRLRGHSDIHVPTPTEPLIIWWIDEIHKMKEDLTGAERKEFYAIVDEISREGRKSGVRIIVGDQDPGVPTTFNDKATLRNSLIGMAGQCVTLRLSSNVDAMIPGIKVRPEKIPALFPDGTKTSGLGVLVGDAEMFRVCTITTSDELAENAPAIAVEKVTANRMGTNYTERHQRMLAENAALAAELQEDDPALVAEIIAAHPELAAALPTAIAVRERIKEHEQKRASEPRPETREMVIGVPRAVEFGPVAQPNPDPETWTCTDAVRKVMRAGVNNFGEIRKQAVSPKGTTYSETTVRNSLAELIKLGEAKDGGYGRFDYLGQRIGAA